MQIEFFKYQGTGNDFVMIDNRHQFFDKKNAKLIALLCDRRFGIGADGLILLENHNALDFKMVYFNADGNESTMCGNGGRCITAFAKHLGIINNKATFEAIDGMHLTEIKNDIVKLKMQDVKGIQQFETHLFLDTGSPHHVEIHNDIEAIEIKEKGSKIRYGAPYHQLGANVNFVEKQSNDIFSVRTYERGVEDETLSCGTGVTAVAIAMHHSGKTNSNLLTLKTKGGDLKVAFKKAKDSYEDVWLIGPATMVFKGEIEC